MSTKNKTKGYVMSQNTTRQVNQFPSRSPKGSAPLSDIAEAALTDTLDKCDKLTKQGDKQVLFVLSPFCCRQDQKRIFNTAMDMVRERGYTVLDFNTQEMYEELGLDFNKDFYNSKHLNYIGAEKYTRYLSGYLAAHYDLTDHRGQEGYESWDKAYEAYKDFVSGGIDTIQIKEKPGGEVKTIKYQGKVLDQEALDEYNKTRSEEQ